MAASVRIHCNSCGRETNHEVRCAHTRCREDFVKEAGVHFEERETMEVLQCLGCEEMAVRQSFEHEAYGESIPRFYPPRISRRTPVWKDMLPKPLVEVVNEVYSALQANSPRLAVIGARTIVDLLILDKIGDFGTFVEKLAALEDHGYVGHKNREFISAALDAGSAAAHRGVAPNLDDLNRVMDIVESLLETVYVLERTAQRLRDVTPARPRHGERNSQA